MSNWPQTVKINGNSVPVVYGDEAVATFKERTGSIEWFHDAIRVRKLK